jgi:hypothetical protein
MEIVEECIASSLLSGPYPGFPIPRAPFSKLIC